MWKHIYEYRNRLEIEIRIKMKHVYTPAYLISGRSDRLVPLRELCLCVAPRFYLDFFALFFDTVFRWGIEDNPSSIL